jgi:Cu/Ag efflux pump CusA
VVGGLLFATFATLILVPTMYRLWHRPVRHPTATHGEHQFAAP